MTPSDLPVLTELCQVSQAGSLCGTPTNEVWDADGMVDEVNAALRESGSQLFMTGPAICEKHMWETPEL